MPTYKQKGCPPEYLIYTRRSTDDLKNQRNTIEYQTDRCVRSAATQGVTVSSVSIPGFCEGGIIKERHTAFKTSALEIQADGTVKRKIERPKFGRLVGMLAARAYRGVVCLCWDRLSRNGMDDAVIKDLLSRGVDIRFVDVTYDNSSAGALHMDIDGMFAAHHSRVSSERIRRTNAKLRAEGKHVNRAPVGYLDNGPGNKPFDPARAPVVKRLFELYATGEWSVSQLVRWSHQQGLTTKPLRSPRTRDEVAAGVENTKKPACRPLAPNGLIAILKNPFYVGRIVHEDSVLPGCHQPLVSEALFRRVQEKLRARTQSVHYPEREFFTYRGMVRCTCQRSYSPYRQKGFTYYYAGCHPGCGNGKKSLREDAFDDLVVDLLGRIHLTDREMAELEKRAPRILAIREGESDKRRRELENRQIRIKRDLAYLEENKIALLREGAYMARDLAYAVAKLQAELGSIGETIARAEAVDERQMLDGVVSFLELVRLAKLRYKEATPERKQALLRSMVLELAVANGAVARLRPKEHFARFIRWGEPRSCGPEFVFQELELLYPSVVIGAPQLEDFLRNANEATLPSPHFGVLCLK